MSIYALLILMMIMTVMMTVIIYRNHDGKTANIIFVGFLLRICATVVGYLGVLPLLGHREGSDSWMFDRIATYNLVHDGFYLKKTNFTDVLTVIYMLTDGSRLFAQFLNVLLSTWILILTSKMLSKLEVPQTTSCNLLKVLAFMPIPLCYSGALMRESWVAFFLALSLYYFVEWFISGSTNKMVLTVLAAFIGSYMHGGSVIILAGFFLAFTSYKPSIQKIHLSGSTIVAGIFISLVVIIFLANMDSLGGKFSSMGEEGVEGVMVSGYDENRANSAYLTWLKVDNPMMGFLFSPLRMFYFLFSPIPFDWRSTVDVMSFAMDSSVYVYLCWNIFKYRKNENGKMRMALRKYLVISLLALTFVFAFGTGNSGTAMRHRSKFTSLFVIAYAVSVTQNKRTKEISC